MRNIFFLLILSSLNIYTQKNNLYVMIDNEFNSLYKFEIDENNSLSSIKILKDEYKKTDFIVKKSSKKSDNDVIVVKKQPVRKIYYEFQSYEKPKVINNISTLKIYNIQDVSKNIKKIREIWTNYKYSIVFIKKENCNYKLWKMKPIYLE